MRAIDADFKCLLFQQKFKHKISKDNIVYNFRVIDAWLKTKFNADKDNDKRNFKQKILEKCEFVIFTVNKEDEAFQLFDSQNTRGKELEPYDLLKAFHLREMEFDTENERIKCVERWEKSIDENSLKPILGNHLYKIRKWSKNEWKYEFTKGDIDEFKGISLHKNQKFPYESVLRMLDGFVDNAQNDKFLKNLHIAQSYPFSITMPIINGKRFFEYVDFYIKLKNELFDNDRKNDFIGFYKKRCLEYNGAGRSGDKKVRNLYENILLSFIDKFGFDVDNFKGYYIAFYKVAYNIRCSKSRICLETILKDDAKQIFPKINDAINPDSLKNYQYKIYNFDIQTPSVKGIEDVIEFLNNGNNGN